MKIIHVNQSPQKKYRELIGTAVCVFNSNNGFIIENILRIDNDKTYNWFELTDRTSGRLSKPIKRNHYESLK